MKNQLIINEKKYIEDILASNEKPEQLTVTQLILLLSKYYYYMNKILVEAQFLINNIMHKYRYSISEYQEYIGMNCVKKYYDKLQSGKLNPLRTDDYIPIYKKELDIINSCGSDRRKKLLFTLYAIARHTNKYGWVYQKRSDLFKYANISKTKDNIIYDLYKKGFVRLTNKVDDVKIGVVLKEYPDEDIAFKIYDLSNIGNQYISFVNKDYKLCKVCKKLIKIKNKNDHSTKYCKTCLANKQKEWNSKYMNNVRK